MYRYDEFDHAFVQGRVEQFRDQVERRLSGELAEDAFKPLRLMNGVYLQLHAYMLRVAIPYGTLNAKQMRMLAHIARKYDRGYGHFTFLSPPDAWHVERFAGAGASRRTGGAGHGHHR